MLFIIHKSGNNLYIDAGIVSLYLPAYHPFYNLVEYFFNSIKAWERHNQRVGEWEALISFVSQLKDKKEEIGMQY